MNRPTEEINSLKQFVAEFPFGNSRYGNEITWDACRNLYSYIDQLEKALDKALNLMSYRHYRQGCEDVCESCPFRCECKTNEHCKTDEKEALRKWVFSDE